MSPNVAFRIAMVNWTASSHYLRIPLAVLFGVGVLLCVFMLVLMFRRRHRMIIRERSFLLLVISCVGNLAGMTCISIDGLLEDDTDLQSWSLFYANLFFEYVFFVPYLLRIYHIKVAYIDFLSDETHYRLLEHRLYFRWYWRFLVLGLIPYSVVPILLGILYHCKVLDSQCSSDCQML